jgi:hypothetical protein
MQLVGEGPIAKIAEYVDLPRGGEQKSGVLSNNAWAPSLNSSGPRVDTSGPITSSV